VTWVYNYRIFDRYNRSVMSLAVLTDNRVEWRPGEFAYGDWGYRTRVRYGQLLDYAQPLWARAAALEERIAPLFDARGKVPSAAQGTTPSCL
jgi:hypothetical protein